jgi:Fe-S-cluster-containing hydrogenase component 2
MFVGRPFCRFLCPYGAILSVAARWPSYGVRITPDDCIKCSLCGGACPFGAIERPRSAHRAPRRTRAILWASAAAAVPALAAAGWWAAGGFAGAALGAWAGVVTAAKLVSLGGVPERKEYEVDHAECFSCGRCYKSCPHERKRLKAVAEAGEETALPPRHQGHQADPGTA